MYVYLIQSGIRKSDPVKVGMSKHPEKRIKQLQTGNPKDLRILLIIKCESSSKAFLVEKSLHSILASTNIKNEWYSVSKSRILKALNLLANDPSCDQVINRHGLFVGMTEQERSKKKADSRVKQMLTFGELEDRLMIRIASYKTVISEMEAKLNKRKKEAGLMRAKLFEFGFDGDKISRLIGRK